MFLEEESKTHSGLKYLMYDNKQKTKRIMIFCSPIGLRILARALFWHGDGTFHTAAKYFTQLYILHGWLSNRMIPSAFILMNRRRTKDYNEVSKAILAEAIKLNLVLNPKVKPFCQ